MIHHVLEFLRVELRDSMGLADLQISNGHLHTLLSGNVNPGVRLSIVNVSQETSMRNDTHQKRTLSGQVRYQNPPAMLNIFIMIAFDFGAYETDLIRLSQTIELFQSKPFFDAKSARSENPFPVGAERIVLDLHSVDTEQLNQIWSMLGGTYFPSCLYQVRLVKVDSNNATDAIPITELKLDVTRVET